MQNKTLRVAMGALVVMALACSAYAAPAAKPAAAKKLDQKKALEDLWKAPDSTVVGAVDGVKVTKGELVKALWFWNAPTTLQDILNQKMIEQAATKAGVKLTPAELQAKIQESLKRMGMQDVDALLNQYHVTYQRFISGTKMSALAEKTVQKQVKVSDAEYAEWLKARHILIRFPSEEKDQAKKEEIAKKKADEVYAKIKAGEDFAKLADEYSEDPSNVKDGKKQGGDLGWFSKGRMVQEFEKAAFEMKAGEVSQPVKTFYGYHIIRVDKLGKDATAAEKADLNKQILERKIPMEMGKWFQDLQSKTKIDSKLMAPPTKEPTPSMRRQPSRMMPPPRQAPRPEAPKTEAPKTAPAPAPAEKPAAPPAGEKPETPPPPPPPTP